MSTIEELEEALLKTFNSSNKESLSDIGIDGEERDKIENVVSSSISSDLNVDYSSFANHVFFGSAYAAANFALQRIGSDYPFDGELKDKDEWRKANSPYENWFFENYPKQQGYLYLQSGTAGVAVHPYVDDYQGLLSPNSGTNKFGSYCVEAVIAPNPSIASGHINGIYSYFNTGSKGHFGYIQNVGGSKYVTFGHVDENNSSHYVSMSYDSYLNSSHMVSYVWNSLINSGTIYLDGAPVVSHGTSSVFISCSLSGAKLRVGSYNGLNFSGAMDDFRYWVNQDQPRSEELIKRNYFRTIHGNISGGLKLYWKFNQPSEYGNKVVDQSGNELHGQFSGNFSYATNFVSGTLGNWFKDVGDPILSLINPRVSAFVDDQRVSGSAYDDTNSNLIFNLVPSFFTDSETDTEYQKLFLLLTARHFDRLKLYIQHLGNVTKMQTGQFDGPPSNLLDVAAKHYGIDIGDIYTGSDPLQYFFGENVYSSGSMTDSLSVVKHALKRNIVSNLIYLIKTKSTQEAIKSVLHSVGLNENIVSINEFTDLSGGIATTFSPKTIESRVLRLSGAARVSVDTKDFSSLSGTVFQVRTLFNTASVSLTQSILTHEHGGEFKTYASVERENLTSSNGKFVLRVADNVPGIYRTISSSFLPMFDNEWVNFSFKKTISDFSFYVSSIDRGGLIFSQSARSDVFLSLSSSANQSIILGTSGTNFFDGWMQEFRGWCGPPTGNFINSIDPFSASSVYYRYAHDWSLSELSNFEDISNLKVHLKMNDYTGSATGIGEIHNWTGESTGSTYIGLSSSADFNFPGKYITKFDVPTSYDLNVDNDKIRIKNGSSFNVNDQNIDIPFVSIDFSPITPLNKEIMRWIGDISKFSNISVDPMDDYKQDNLKLANLRQIIFEKRFNSKINFAAFGELIKWFDNNFAYLISQFIPLDLAYSLSNYVIEPHILEYNKNRKIASIGSIGRNTVLETSISIRPNPIVASAPRNLGLADPGRFGSFVSSSAAISKQFVYTSSSNGLNHSTYYEKRMIENSLRDNVENWSPKNYGNAFYTRTITGSNYLKNVLNVVDKFNITGVFYQNSTHFNQNGYMSSSHGPPGFSSFTSSMNGVQDARWLWMQTRSSGSFNNLLFDHYVLSGGFVPYRNRREFQHNHGIGYGGMWGQLQKVSHRSTIGAPKFISSSYDPVVGQQAFGLGYWIGNTGYLQNNQIKTGYWESQLNFSNYIEYFEDDDSPTKILWPRKNAHNGISLYFNTGQAFFENGNNASSIGDTINIEEFNSLNLEILGKVLKTDDDVAPQFDVQFQFFSRETPGLIDFESIISSSVSPGEVTNKNVKLKYRLTAETILAGSTDEIFHLTMQRPLPKQKYMRVLVSVSTPGPAIGTMICVVRAKFSKDEVVDKTVEERG